MSPRVTTELVVFHVTHIPATEKKNSSPQKIERRCHPDVVHLGSPASFLLGLPSIHLNSWAQLKTLKYPTCVKIPIVIDLIYFPTKKFNYYSSISSSTELLINVTLVSHFTLILKMADLIDSYCILYLSYFCIRERVASK